jgi:hypothetical protein
VSVRPAAAVLLGLVVSASAGCGGKKEATVPAGLEDGRGLSRKAAVDPPVAGYMFATVRERTIGPLLARRGSAEQAAGLAAWVTVAEGSGRRVIVVAIGARGIPRGSETVIANVSVDTTSLVVKPMRGQAPGFVVAWTSLTDRGKSLWAVAVSDNGEPRTKPVELTRTDDDIVWLDVLPTDKGAVCMWAEETRGSDANLLAAPLDTDGHVRGAATRMAAGVVGWHALEAPEGIGLSTVTVPPRAPEGKGKGDRPLIRENRPGGALTYRLFDADAHPLAPAVVVTPKPIVSGDVEVTRRGGRLVFAWTDRTAEEPSVAIATLDEALAKAPAPAGAPARIESAHKLADARGGASLLGLASGPAGLAVMFEAPVRRKGESRRVHVARVGPSWVVERPMLSLDVVGRGQPELAATASGFAVLATTPNCELESPSCANADALATVLRTDDKLALVQREPLTFMADPATIGWGMSCDGEACIALAASPSPGEPSRIRTAVVRPRAGSKPIPSLSASMSGAAPKASAYIADVTAIASGETVVDIATTRIGDADLVATLTVKGEDPAKPASAGPAPSSEDAKMAPVTLTTRVVGDSGESTAPNVITVRALPVGGVAIAGAEKPEDGAAVAYVARQGGDPEVRVARLDRRGRKTADVQLTSAKGDASDVTITWAGNGWVVAWVDGRDGNGEVYATKVTMDLVRLSHEERLTTAKGDASDLTALAVGHDVWLAWADPRDSASAGVADVFVTAVHMRDAKRAFDEQRLLATAAHSRTPQLALGPTGPQIVWIEEAPMGAETPSASGYGAFWARLDATGKPTDPPIRVPLAGDGVATSAVLDLAGKPPHAIVARSTPDGISLDGVDLGASPPRAAALLALDGPPSLDVALALAERRSGDAATSVGSVVYFNDDGPRPADRRARRARVSWTAEK